ncbi:MAG TPA: phosphohistidine phosphatase SixA [Candidatus Angelobacter sp.]|jgi:phosphohistidine phosphatase|nr:phosphohistidine phosphatase SixA [Candidatus Angelobacter sp.]
MLLYFLRHASAGKSTMNPKKDERRPLDEEGMLQARYVGRLLANLDVQVDQIISSPLKRALQTATLVANELAFEAAVQIDEALRPEAEFDQFQTMLARYKKYDAVMVVGHNPSLTEFLSKAVSGASGSTHIDFRKAAVARVEMDGRTGTLDWLVTPKIARTLQTSLKSSSRPKTSRK